MDYNHKDNDNQNFHQILYQCLNCSTFLLSIISCNKHSKRCCLNKEGVDKVNTASVFYQNFQLVSFPVPQVILSRLDSEFNPPTPPDSVRIEIQVEPDFDEMDGLIKKEPIDIDHIIYNEDYFGKLQQPVDFYTKEEEGGDPDHSTDYCDSLESSTQNQNYLNDLDNQSCEDIGAPQNNKLSARKREQNRLASWRLRQKYKVQINNLCIQATELEEENANLEMKKEELQSDIKTVKNLLLEKLAKSRSVHHLVKVEEEEKDEEVEEEDNFDNILQPFSLLTPSYSIPTLNCTSATDSIIVETPKPIILPRHGKRKHGRTNEDKKKPSIEITSDMDKVTKKREVNRQAVLRYRQRRQEELSLLEDEIDFLERANEELKQTREDLRKQINLVKNLIREEMKNSQKK